MLVLQPLMRTTKWWHVVAATLTVAASAVAIVVGKKVRRKMKIASRIDSSIPGPQGTFLLGLAPEFYKNLHRLYDYQAELLTKYGGRMREPWGLMTNNIVFISDPKDLEHVLSTNVDNYIKSDEFVSSLGIFKPTLLGVNHAHTADNGAMFRVQRKLIARVFTANHFREFTKEVFHKHALRTIDVINAAGGKCEMHKIASQFTLQTIFDIGLGLSLEDYDRELGLKFVGSMDTIFLAIAARLIYKPYWRYLWWCMPSEYRLKRECNVLTSLIDGIIKDRSAETPDQFDKRSDILSMCIRKAREMEAEGDGLLDSKTLLSCVTGLLFGGRDTISASVLYCFYNLAQYPEEQEKIFAELQTVDVGKLTYEDVKKLKYLDAFVWETLRFHPVTPINQRQAAEDDRLPDGTFIPAGTEIFWSTYYIGRNNAKLWGEDQAVFRPERWLEMKRKPTMYEYPVFQAGLRTCPGMNMALLETKVFLAIMVDKFRVKIQDGEQVKDRPYEIALAMMMKDGLPLQLTPREALAA